MLALIEQLLFAKGYHLFDDNEPGILVRETEEHINVVTLSTYREDVTYSDYESATTRTNFQVVTRYGKKARMLHLIAINRESFDDKIIDLMNHLPNAWLVSSSTGRIFLFENQISEFDGLYEHFEQGVKAQEKKQAEAIFRLTPVNTVIVVLNILIHIVVSIYYGDFFATYQTENMLAVGALAYDHVMEGEWYRIITACFLHFGWSHLFNNMLLLTYAGCELERRIGSISYVCLYALTGIVGNIASLFYYHSVGEVIVSAGASGAIFGVIGALIVVLIVQHTQTHNLTPRRLMFTAGVTIYYGLTTMGVDNAAHLGGFLCGLFGGFLLSKISRYVKLK